LPLLNQPDVRPRPWEHWLAPANGHLLL